MSLATVASQVNLLKRLVGNDVAKAMYDKSKFLSNCTKDTQFHGRNREVVVRIAPTAGGSPSYEDAIANQAPTNNKTFTVTRKREYSVFSIENELISAGKAGIGAIVDTLKSEAEGALQLFNENMARRGWNLGGGSVGVIHASTNLATTTLQFAFRTEIIGGIHPGTKLYFADDNGTATNLAGLRGGGAVPLTVVSVNRTAGTCVVSAALNTVPDIAVGDFIYTSAGAYGNALTGLPGWATSSEPTSDLFFGLDRTVDSLRLAGIRVAFATDITTTLQNAGSEAGINGITPKHCYINHIDYRVLLSEMDDKVQITDGKGIVGYKSVMVNLPTGPVEMIPEQFVPQGFAWLGDTAEFILGSSGECPKMLTEGVTKSGLLRIPTQDGWRGELGMYGNFFVKDKGKGPGGWVVADVAA